jgi:hypothetical protein
LRVPSSFVGRLDVGAKSRPERRLDRGGACDGLGYPTGPRLATFLLLHRTFPQIAGVKQLGCLDRSAAGPYDGNRKMAVLSDRNLRGRDDGVPRMPEPKLTVDDSLVTSEGAASAAGATSSSAQNR